MVLAALPMALLPIVDRELRIVSRKTSLYWGRLIFAGLGILILCMHSLSKEVPATMSHELFETLALFTFVFCGLAGTWVTSDCLSEERRGETLGLLFLTNLRGFDVVLGKMTATSLRSVYGVLAVFPVMAVPLIIGGVAFSEFCRVMFALLVTLLVSLSLGVMISSRSRIAVKSGTAVFLLMLGLCFLGPAIGLIVDSGFSTPTQNLVLWMCFPSPGFAVISSFELNYQQAAFFYWASIALNVAITIVMLSLACVFVRREWQDRTLVEGGAVAVPNQSLANRARLSARRSPKVRDSNPIFWSLSRQSKKPKRVLVVLGILGGLWIGGSLLTGEGYLNEANYLFTAFFVQLILKCWVGAEATTRFGEDQRSGALELVLCSPIRIREILSGHWQAFYWQFFWPVFFVLMVDLLFLLDPLTSQTDRVDPSMLFFVKIFTASMILFIVDLYALSWLGMWKGLNGRRVNRTILSNLLTVLALPWGVFVGIAFLLAASSGPAVMSARDEVFFLGLWFFLGLANSAYWIFWGRRCLTTELRRMAPFQAGDSMSDR